MIFLKEYFQIFHIKNPYFSNICLSLMTFSVKIFAINLEVL